MSYIEVYDNLIPEELVKEIHRKLHFTGFKRTERDYSDQDFANAMAVADLVLDDDLVQELMSKVYPLVPNAEELYCYRVYANCYTPSDSPEPHKDQCENNGFTVLYYANSEWSWENGGETVFFDENREIIKAVLPKPGRVVIFQPDIHHTARVQNILGPKFRYTIAIKLRKYGSNEVL